MCPSEPSDFTLQPYQGRARAPETPRMVEEALDAPLPGAPEEEGVAESTPRRRKRNTARLVWDSKPKKAPNPKNLGFQIAEVVVPNPASQAGPRLPFDPGTQEVDTQACNRLIWGDNLLVMQALLAQGYEGKINLIYIDPPFDSKADYSHSVQLTPDESGQGGGELNAEMSVLERLAYRDTWEDGTDSYLDMLYPRFQLINRLLTEDGSFFIHCDWRISSYIKTLCEEIFGKSNILNEIIWKRKGGSANPSNKLGTTTDSILWICKNEKKVYYNSLTTLNSDEVKKYIEERFTNTDELGRRYMKSPIVSPGYRENLVYNYKGYTPPPNGWSISKSVMEKWDSEGRLYFPPKGVGDRIYRKIFIEEYDGQPIQSLWTDIFVINPVAQERLEYPTQKPEALLERIIRMTSRPGDLVADFFCGSGTAAAAAEKLGRRWITSDLGKASIQVARNRFVKMGETESGGIAFQRPDSATRCAPFVVENLGNYQRQLLYLNDTRLKQVGTLILTLYGAQPHPTERALGVQGFNDPETGRFQRRLVLVGDPDRPLSAKRVAEAARSLKSLDGGGYSRLVALGWDFELNFDSALDKHLGPDWRKVVEVRQIPTEVIEYLKKIPADAGPDDPAVERLRAQVAFFEKPFLAPPELKILGWTGEAEPRLRVSLTLTRYLLRGLPMGLQGKKLSETEARDLIQKAGGPAGLNLIDFWSVDDDLGGEDGKRPFTSTWQALRGLGKRVRPVATETELLYVPRPGRRVAMRLVDLFGNDALWTGLLPDAEDARRAGV